MKEDQKLQRIVWIALAAFLGFILFVCWRPAHGATVVHSETLQAPGYDSVRVVVKWDSLGTWVQATESVVTVPTTISLSLADTRDQQVRYIWFEPTDSVATWDDFLYVCGTSDTTQYPLPLISPDYDSVLIEIADRADTDTVYTARDTAVVTLPIDTTVSLVTARDSRIKLVWYSADTSSSTIWLSYRSILAAGPPAPDDADLCRVWGHVQSFAGVTGLAQLRYVQVSFVAPEKALDTCSQEFTLPSTRSTYTDSSGYFQIDLLPTTCWQGKKYKLYITGPATLGQPLASKKDGWDVEIPDTSTYHLLPSALR